MLRNYSSRYEVSSQDTNFPARIILFDKPGKDCYIDKHWHKTIEINYVLRGDLVTEVLGEKNVLSDGKFTLINSCDVHQSKGKYENTNVKFLVIMYSSVFIRNYFPDFEKYRFEVENEEIYMEIKEQLDVIVNAIKTADQLSELHILAALISILDIVFSKCKIDSQVEEIKYSENDAFDYSKRVIEYIKDHYKERLTIESVAATIGLSPTYFAAYFKKKTNKSFLVYLNDFRMQRAIVAMQSYDVPETQAALDNGFANVKSFITTFKRNYKCTPSQYIKQHGELPKVFGFNKNFEENHFV